MRRLAILMLTGALALGVQTGVQAAARTAPSPADEEAAEQASRRGHLIYVLDRAGWTSADALVAAIPDLAASGIRGWVVDTEGYHLKTIYYRLEGDQPFAVFTADIQDGEVIASRLVPAGPAAALSPRLTRMVRARQAAMRTEVQPCTHGAMNTVVIPPGRSEYDPIEVYVLSAQVKAGELPFGGHYKLTVDGAGKVIEQRALTGACTSLPTSKSQDGNNSEALVVAHSLDATPTEVHVFGAMHLPVPVYVMTPASLPDAGDQFRVWRLKSGMVQYLATQKADAAPTPDPVP